MTDRITATPPETLLLATDLSPRCDRALDRAAQLAVQWKATLVALHVLEPDHAQNGRAAIPSWRRQRDAALVADTELRADLLQDGVVATALVEPGEPADVVARVAQARSAGLIVLGLGRDEVLGRYNLGTTVDALLRHTAIPILVVKNRTRGPYRKVVAAVDFADASRHALLTAHAFFPGAALTLFHAFSAPFQGIISNVDKVIQEFHAIAATDCAKFLASIAADGIRLSLRETLLEHGPPAPLLRDYAWEKGMDLLVMGTNNRGAFMDFLIGSTARSILDQLPCDALILRAPPATA